MDYYNNPDLWDDSHIHELDKQRVDKLVEILPRDVSSLLDIGSGRGLFLESLNRKTKIRRLVGLDLSFRALKFLSNNKINASADALPLKDNSFDCVAALEVIEHLPESVIDKSLSEISRVTSKYIIITVPNNEDLAANTIVCANCGKRFNPNYHFRSFQIKDMKSLFQKGALQLIKCGLIGSYKAYIIIPELRDLFSKKKMEFPISIPCPLCGKYSQKQEAIKSSLHKANTLKVLLKKIWPKRKKYRWIMALYKKK